MSNKNKTISTELKRNLTLYRFDCPTVKKEEEVAVVIGSFPFFHPPGTESEHLIKSRGYCVNSILK